MSWPDIGWPDLGWPNLGWPDLGWPSDAGGGAGSLAINDISVTEGVDANAVFTVTRSGGSTGAISVDYTTVAGTALAGADYTTTTGTLNFADGDLTKTITVPIINNEFAESTEQFTIVLSNVVGGATITDDTGICTISDDSDVINSFLIYAWPYPVIANL